MSETDTRPIDKHDLTITPEKAEAIFKAIKDIHPGLADAFAMAGDAVSDESYQFGLITIKVEKRK